MRIETERLLLRPLTLADADELADMHAAPEVIRTMGKFEPARVAARLESYEREWADRGYGLMAVIERATGRFLGRSGLKYWPQFDETEVGWVLRPDAWGHGFATEAGRACIAWAFRELELPYVTAMILSDNVRSIHVAERLSMRPRRTDRLFDLPVVVYAIERGSTGTSTARTPEHS